MSAVTLKNIVKRFGGFTAVHQTSLEIPEGAFVTLLGPSGCGRVYLEGVVEKIDGELLQLLMKKFFR